MDKPLLKDYGLTPELAKGVLAANKRRYRLFWWTVNGCVIVVILAIALFLPASLSARLAAVAGLIVIFYTLNYASVFKRLAIRIFKEHPKEKDLKRYLKAMKQYNFSERTNANNCLVCNQDLGETTTMAAAHHTICPSCGIQYGYTDAAGGFPEKREKIYKLWREAWIANNRKALSNEQCKGVIKQAMQ